MPFAPAMVEVNLSLSEPELVLSLFGARDQHLRLIRDTLNVTITHRDGQVRVAGEQPHVETATEAFERLRSLADRRGHLTVEDVSRVLAQVTGNDELLPPDQIDVLEPTRRMSPRTPGQARYVTAVRDHSLVFAIGPAGSGKTYLAVAMAVEALKHKLVRKIVLVRPAVEAGESLGFLPGDLQAKINPYLRPLLDALHDMIDREQIKRYMEQDIIEVIPLAYMRGRTLNQAFIILDEAQNTTISQMKMFLTRMGEDSRIVVAGDITQIDLPPTTRSGLIDALGRLKHLEGVKIVELNKSDIVRHRLVQDIVMAYDDHAPRRPEGKADGKSPDPPDDQDAARSPAGRDHTPRREHRDGRRRTR